MLCIILWSALSAADGTNVEIFAAPPGVPGIQNVIPMTHGPKHHFFGYFGIQPWNDTGQYLICMETDFGDRAVTSDDTANLLLLDTQTRDSRVIAKTHAWNFQQGSLAHWLPTAADRCIIYNDRMDGQLRSVILDIVTGEKRELPRPIAAVSHDGKRAASINYARLAVMRPGYGYMGVDDPWANDNHPKDDGLYIMDIENGTVNLIVSLDQLYQACPVPEPCRQKKMWMNHVLFSRDDQRIFFMGRFKPSVPGPLVTAAFTVAPDGRDLRCVLPYSWGASHYDWLDGKRMAVVARFQEGTHWKHVFFADGAPLESYTTLAPQTLDSDGHCHFSPNAQWMVTDSYPQGPNHMQSLYLMDVATQNIAKVVQFHEPSNFNGDWRCDLHPRWSRDNQRICIDSTHDGTRQVYLLELAMPEKTEGK